MIDWCALLIPIYPPHYEYAYAFIEKTVSIFPLFFVFSSEDDVQSFKRKSDVHSIILPATSPNGIINKKKLYGLHTLQESFYEYIIVLDAETDFIQDSFSETHFRKTIETLFEQKLFFGKNIEGFKEKKTMRLIMNSCMSIFPQDVWTSLLEETNNMTTYTWWSEIPVYKRNHLPEFLSYIHFETLQWEHFDHILYTYYLIAYHNYKIKDVSSYVMSTAPLDFLVTDSEKELVSLYKEGIQFSYINYVLYRKHTPFFKRLGTSFLCHLDRSYLESK